MNMTTPLFDIKVKLKKGWKASYEALHPISSDLKTVTCPTGLNLI